MVNQWTWVYTECNNFIAVAVWKIPVNAPSLGEAIEEVMRRYQQTEIVLDAEDFQEVSIEQERKERGR